MLLIGSVELLRGESRSSAAYEIISETIDAGGGYSTAAGYANHGGLGTISPATILTAPTLTARSGFIGQLYEVVSFQVAAPADSVRTGAQLLLRATLLLDDGTTLLLDPNRVAWSVVSGPMTGIGPAGLATAGAVAVDTPAAVRGGFGIWSAQFALTVLAKLAQHIVFAPPNEVLFQLAPLGLNATATSGLPVGFVVVEGPATVNGGSLILSDVGTVIVRAIQAGGTDFTAAEPIERTVLIRDSFEHWQAENFSPAVWTQANISGPGATPMADGWPNLLKYALGISLADSAGAPQPTLSTDAADWIYTYVRPADRSDVDYTVEVSSNLSTWASTGVAHEFVSSSSGIETWRARHTLSMTPRLFFRLRVSR